jgi:hypothetical protein
MTISAALKIFERTSVAGMEEASLEMLHTALTDWRVKLQAWLEWKNGASTCYSFERLTCKTTS